MYYIYQYMSILPRQGLDDDTPCQDQHHCHRAMAMTTRRLWTQQGTPSRAAQNPKSLSGPWRLLGHAQIPMVVKVLITCVISGIYPHWHIHML